MKNLGTKRPNENDTQNSKGKNIKFWTQGLLTVVKGWYWSWEW